MTHFRFCFSSKFSILVCLFLVGFVEAGDSDSAQEMIKRADRSIQKIRDEVWEPKGLCERLSANIQRGKMTAEDIEDDFEEIDDEYLKIALNWPHPTTNETILTWLCSSEDFDDNKLDIIHFLLESGARVNQCDGNDKTAIGIVDENLSLWHAEEGLVKCKQLLEQKKIEQDQEEAAAAKEIAEEPSNTEVASGKPPADVAEQAQVDLAHRQDHSAQILQAVLRGHIARKKAAIMKEERKEAARILQAATEGHAARKIVRDKKMQSEQAAAQQLQAASRGFSARTDAQQSIKRLEALERTLDLIVSHNRNEDNSAAVDSWKREVESAKEEEKKLHAAKQLQAGIRGHVARADTSRQQLIATADDDSTDNSMTLKQYIEAVDNGTRQCPPHIRYGGGDSSPEVDEEYALIDKIVQRTDPSEVEAALLTSIELHLDGLTSHLLSLGGDFKEQVSVKNHVLDTWKDPIYPAFSAEDVVKFSSETCPGSETTDSHQTVLMYCTASGNVECVKRLLMQKVDVRAKDVRGRTALMVASACLETRCVEVMELLLQAIDKDTASDSSTSDESSFVQAADPAVLNQTDSKGWSALTYAIANSNLDLIGLLHGAGAANGNPDMFGMSPMGWSMMHPNAGAILPRLGQAVNNPPPGDGLGVAPPPAAAAVVPAAGRTVVGKQPGAMSRGNPGKEVSPNVITPDNRVSNGSNNDVTPSTYLHNALHAVENFPSAHWPDSMIYSNTDQQVQSFSWEKQHIFYFEKGATDDMIQQAAFDVATNVESPQDNHFTPQSKSFELWVDILSTCGEVTYVPSHGIRVSQSTVDEAVKKLSKQQREEVGQYVDKPVERKTKSVLDCDYETKFINNGVAQQVVASNCCWKMYVAMHGQDSTERFRSELDASSRGQFQDYLNRATNAQSTSFVQKAEEKEDLESILNGKQLIDRAGIGFTMEGKFAIGSGNDFVDEYRTSPDSLPYWVGQHWKDGSCIFPLMHFALVVLSTLYLVYRYFVGRHARAKFQMLHNEAMECSVSRERARKSSGCGPNDMIDVIPLARSWIGLFLQVCWVLLLLTTFVVLYLVQYQGFYPAQDRTGSKVYGYLLLVSVLVELACFAFAWYFGMLQNVTLIPISNGNSAAYALVEIKLPVPGSNAAVSIHTAIADIADPKTEEDDKFAKRQQQAEQFERERAVVSDRLHSINPATCTASITDATTQPQSIQTYRPPLITRAQPPAFRSPPLPSNYADCSEEQQSIEGQQLFVATSVTLKIERRCVDVRGVDETMQRFIHDGIVYGWNNDLHCYEQYDFEREAIRFAHVRLRSGLPPALVKSRRFFTGKCVTDDDSRNYLSVLMKCAGSPYVLVTLFSVLWVAPRFAVFWFLTLGLFVLCGVALVFGKARRGFSAKCNDDHTIGVKVIRDGRDQWLPQDEIVPGDIVYLTNDLVVPFDAVVLVNGVVMREASLTGDMVPAEKYPIDDHKRQKDKVRYYPHNRVWAGSKVLHASQRSLAVVTSIGSRTQKGYMLQEVVESRLPFKSLAEKISRDARSVFLFIVLVYVSMWVLRACYFAVHSFRYSAMNLKIPWHVQAVVTMAFMAQDLVYNEVIWACFDIGLVLLPWFVSRELYRHRLRDNENIQCHDMTSLPVAAQMNVCIFDKTGTLTCPSMSLTTIIPFQANDFTEPVDCNENTPHLQNLMINVALASCHNLKYGPNGILTGTPLDLSMFKVSGYSMPYQELSGQGFINPPSGSSGQSIEMLHTICFNAQDGVSGVIIQHGSDLLLIVKGSLESILPLTNFDGTAVDCERFMHTGKYAVALAMRRLSPDVLVKIHKVPRKMLIEDLDLLGLLLFENQVRPDSETIVNDLHSAGVSTVMASGDHLLTCMNVARRVGIIPENDGEYMPTVIGDVHLRPVEKQKKLKQKDTARFVVGGESDDWESSCGEDESSSQAGEITEGNLLPHTVVWRNAHTNQIVDEHEALDGKAHIVLTGPAFCRLDQRQTLAQAASTVDSNLFKRILSSVRVCARMSPSDKSRLVQMLREEGNVVGFCGNGWNDGPALSVADVGISMVGEEDLSSVSDFSSSRSSIDIVIDVIRYGQSCLNTSVVILLFGVLQVCLNTYGRLILDGSRDTLHSSMLLRTDTVRSIFMIIIALLMTIAPIARDIKSRPTIRKLFSKSSIIWFLSQLLICFGACLILGLAVFKHDPVSNEDITWVLHNGFTRLYRMKLQTAEGVVACLFAIWFLSTFVFSALIINGKWGKSNIIVIVIGIIIKILVLLFLWAGPSTVSCWLGMQCDNFHAYDLTGECLYGPQLFKLNQLLDDHFNLPLHTDDSRCRYYQGDIPEGVVLPADLKIHAVFGSATCSGPNNCVPNDARWQTSIIFVAASLLSWTASFFTVLFLKKCRRTKLN